ncbi:MAG: 4-hydroxy-3-methylbut-2-enyl diphosphate reductase [Bacteroidales bacterium]|nr:4-hydroxy-3-methylbut-2-enyl diphosphate reductase [Bacteroidales bacterium]
MTVDIDTNAGFCFGVTNAINKAENEIQNSGSLYCLGEIVHNHEETSRLAKLGMKTISYQEFCSLSNTTVLLRAHGEPPSTYQTAASNNVYIIDATCPIVLRLHKLIQTNAQQYPDAQTVIFGKKDHAEVVGLVGQVSGNAVVVSAEDEIEMIDFHRSILLYSQTTMNSHKYNNLAEKIASRLRDTSPDAVLRKFDTVCRSVALREQNLSAYARNHDAIMFVAGANSSNGKYLFSTCSKANPRTYYVSSVLDIDPAMLVDVDRLGITGATSTPKWLLQNVADAVARIV